MGLILAFLSLFFSSIAVGMNIGKAMEKKNKPDPNSFLIEDELNGFRIQGTIHPNTEASHRCEVWVYDNKERISRVRMCGSSMLHVIQAATAEAIYRLAKKK